MKSSDKRLIMLALEEDIGERDITTAALGLRGRPGKAVVVAKSEGIISGMDQFMTVFRILSQRVIFKNRSKNGARASSGERVIHLTGSLDALLRGERTAMNILSHLSGVATMTSRFVEMVRGRKVSILDTRKTMPGMRDWEKAAVRDGGGTNHRRGLYDMYLVKENHIAAAGGMLAAVGKVLKDRHETGAKIEIEVRTIAELQLVLPYRPDYILLDNFSLTDLRKAVELTRQESRKTLLEASGNINLNNVVRVAATGVDRISIGAITHSAPALDLSFRIVD